jgi:hypothetical protein
LILPDLGHPVRSWYSASQYLSFKIPKYVGWVEGLYSNASRFTATHATISVPTSQAEIEQIGSYEQWRVVRCNRDSLFDVMELWVENSLMIEFLTPEMARQNPKKYSIFKSFAV